MTSQPLRVLLVADDDTDRTTRRVILGAAGFTVEAAQTATEALKQLTMRRFDAIITDCALSDLPALDWLAAIRGAAAITPLVVYTTSAGSDTDELRRYAFDFGAAAVIEEPLSSAQLVEAVQAALGQSG